MSGAVRVGELFIAGAWVGGGGRRVRESVDPARAAPCAAMTSATPEDCAAAAQAAAAASPAWSAAPTEARSRILRRIGAGVRARIDAIAPLITAEMGKPLDEARLELEGVARVFEYFASVAAEACEATIDRADGVARRLERTAVGPVLLLNTWNFPVETAATPLAPALAAGCSAVVLANPVAPSAVVALFEILADAGLPPGAVNLLAGDGPSLSAALIEDPRIRHVAYTGSVPVGRDLARRAGAALKRATLELGGNAPAIVLPDADVAQAAHAFAAKRFWNAGQVCTAPNRFYVHRSVHDGFVEAVRAYAGGLVVGPGDDPAVTLGPLAAAQRLAAMREIAADARRRGGREVFAGAAPSGPGFFFPPTVFADVPDDALGMREEIFGPIACIAPYETVDEAVERANRCRLGLSAYVYGADRERAQAVADRLEAGSVGVNQMTTAFIDAPFGGVKESGLGFIGGRQAVGEFQRYRLRATGRRRSP